MDINFKEQTASDKRRERVKPTLITIGKKQVTSSGRWNNPVMGDYVRVHAKHKWLGIGELARTAYHQNTKRSRKAVCGCLHRLFAFLLVEYGELLAVEYDGPNKSASSVKIFDSSSPPDSLERRYLKSKIDRMKKRRELSCEQYMRACQLLG